ncbi:hypothetical protein SCHPADRAFT_897227, partial [Schizopora paradoxa]
MHDCSRFLQFTTPLRTGSSWAAVQIEERGRSVSASAIPSSCLRPSSQTFVVAVHHFILEMWSSSYFPQIMPDRNDAVRDNLKLTIGGLVKVAVRLVDVLEDQARHNRAFVEPVREQEDCEVDRIAANVAGMNIGRNSTRSPRNQGRRDAVQQNFDIKPPRKGAPPPLDFSPPRCSSQAHPSKALSHPLIAEERDPEERHYAIFCGTDVGVVGD